MSSVNLKRKKQTNAQMSEVMDDFDRFEFFFATHWKKIVAVAVIAVLAVAAYCTVSYISDKNKQAAALAFAQAKTIQEYEAAVKEYSDAPGWVYLKMGVLYMEDGKYDQAAENLQKAAADQTVPEIQWRAQLNLATLDEVRGNFATAASAFEDIAKSRREPGTAGFALEAYCAAVRNHLAAKQNAQAAELIKEADEFLSSLTEQEQQMFPGVKMMLASLRSEAATAK